MNHNDNGINVIMPSRCLVLHTRYCQDAMSRDTRSRVSHMSADGLGNIDKISKSNIIGPASLSLFGSSQNGLIMDWNSEMTRKWALIENDF